MSSAPERATEHAQKVEAGLGFHANRKHFEAAAQEYLSPLSVAYADASTPSERAEILRTARGALSAQFVLWDDELGWDFPDKADNVEDTILWLYGQGKAAAALTGSLRNAFPVDALRKRLGYEDGRAG